MIAIKCDRCGEFCKSNKEHKILVDEESYLETISNNVSKGTFSIRKSDDYYYLDLCNECLHDFKDFMKNENTNA